MPLGIIDTIAAVAGIVSAVGSVAGAVEQHSQEQRQSAQNRIDFAQERLEPGLSVQSAEKECLAGEAECTHHRTQQVVSCAPP